MTPSVKRVGRNLLVWLVVISMSVQTFTRAVQGFLDDNMTHLVLYLASTVGLFLLGLAIERLKWFLEDF